MNETSVETAIKNMKTIYPKLQLELAMHKQLEADISAIQELLDSVKEQQNSQKQV